jgi:hypothetical protein
MSDVDSPKITIELFGVPRLKAGCGRVTLCAGTLGAALAGLAERCPPLAGSVVQAGGRLHPAYRVSLGGERFLTDPETELGPNAVLLLLAADVGG